MTQLLVIGHTLPGYNDVTRRNRTHWSVGSKQKADIEDEIGWLIKQQGLKKVKKPVEVEFTWLEENRRRDPDNIVSAKKFILDALQTAGILPNDNQKWIKGFKDKWEVAKETPMVMVKIIEVKESAQ